ncbi:aldehyde dehydrogenase domain-containing protein [Pterulicium gracile]|uniref:Aldehyde dehydrogenase domain-containing protein n=1 Tax=Pterulicium gracile TaxID=1884261 RepID=A0A5C3QC96_9AGAR|nr:aldehyde dehydrogenase domain-containing protein [Pterula gracilis]
MLITSKLFINGQETPCISGKQMTLVDPSTGKEWFQVDEADKEDVEVAVKHAEAAWPAWSATSASVKAAALRKLADLIIANGQELAEVECKTMGKPISLLKWDVRIVSAALYYFASLVETATSTLSTNTPGQLNYTLNQPFGVTAGILPWNLPMLMFVQKIGPAVGAGNAIIIKSSEKAPLTPLILAKLSLEAGFPPGLIQVLSGYGPTVGSALALHMRIRKLSFTGSLAVGKLIQQMSGQSNLKVVTLELGGKSPAIVFEDADLPSAAKQLAYSILMNAGQACIASSRVYVQSSIIKEFLGLYQSAIEAQASVIGSAHDEKTTHGPQVDRVQHEKIKKYLEVGKTEGKVLFGGSAPDREGFFIQPTVFTDAKDEATISREEIFGPVSVVNTFETEEEAVRRSNDTDFGLYASVFSKNIDRATRVAAALESGMVGVNCTSPTISLDMPFGGYKQSGIGRELGPNALSAWKQTKSVFVKL